MSSLEGLKKAVKEGRKIKDPDEPPKQIVTGRGLCWHLSVKYDPQTVYPDSVMPKAECGICRKKWVYSWEEGKFVEE